MPSRVEAAIDRHRIVAFAPRGSSQARQCRLICSTTNRTARGGAPGARNTHGVSIICSADVRWPCLRARALGSAAQRTPRHSTRLRALAAANVCSRSSRSTLGVGLVEISVSVSAWCQSTVHVLVTGQVTSICSVQCVRVGVCVDVRIRFSSYRTYLRRCADVTVVNARQGRRP